MKLLIAQANAELDDKACSKMITSFLKEYASGITLKQKEMKWNNMDVATNSD